MRILQNLLANAAIVCTIGALSACGGGGGSGSGATNSGPVPAPPVAVAPLEVKPLMLSENFQRVSTRADFVLSFSAPLGTSGLRADQVELSDGANRYPVKINVTGPLVTITPEQYLKTQTDYQLTIKAGTTAADGAVLKNDYVLKFHTLRSVFEMRHLTPADPSVRSHPLPRLSIVDVNADGRVDLVELAALYRPELFAANGYTLNVFLQDATGNFSKFQNLEFVADQNGYSKDFSNLIVLDIDGDKSPEVLVPEYRPDDEASTGIRVFKIGTDGKFAVHEWIATNYAETVRAADVDGDGKLDLIGSNRRAVDQVTGGFQVLLHTSTGFTKLAPVPMQLRDEFGVADLDQDGKAELVFNTVFNTGASPLAVYSQGAKGVFSLNNRLTEETRGFCAGPDACGEMEVVDVNGDGKPELVFVGTMPLNSPSRVHIIALTRSSNGVWEKKIDYPMDFNTKLFGIHDMDGDGVRDLVITTFYPAPYMDIIGVRRDFSLDLSNLVALRPLGVDRENTAIGDIDGDGRPDILFDGYNDGIIMWRNLKN